MWGLLRTDHRSAMICLSPNAIQCRYITKENALFKPLTHNNGYELVMKVWMVLRVIWGLKAVSTHCTCVIKTWKADVLACLSHFSWFHSNPSGSTMPYMSWLWEESWVMEVVPSSVICTFRFPLKKMKPHLNCSNHISLYIVCVLCAFRQAGPIDPCLRDQTNILSIPGFIKKLISIVLKPFVSASHLCLIKQSVAWIEHIQPNVFH